MTELLLATLIALVPVDSGVATTYHSGRMDEVVENRVRWGHLDPATFARHKGFIALQDCAYRGKTVWVRLDDGFLAGPYLVADCGRGPDQAWLDSINFAVDVPPPIAQDWGLPQQNVTVFVEQEIDMPLPAYPN